MTVSATGFRGFEVGGIGRDVDVVSKKEAASQKIEKSKPEETRERLQETSISPPEVITEAEKEILDEIREAATILKEETKGIPLSQGMGSLMVGGLVRLHREAHTPEQSQEAFIKARELLTYFETFFGKSSDEWRIRRSGFLGEVCVAIALEEMGFVIKEPSQKEDMDGKVDLWADAKDGTIFAIQVKTSAKIKEINLIKIRGEKENLGLPEGYENYRDSAEGMIKYVTGSKEFEGKKIVPILIELPGGEGNEHAAYNIVSGLPLKETSQRIIDLFFERIWNDKQ